MIDREFLIFPSTLLCSLQMHNMVKLFDLAQGGDLRCIVLDSHRPIHLANIYSRHNVVVMGDGEVDRMEGLSSGSEYSDNESDDEEVRMTL